MAKRSQYERLIAEVRVAYRSDTHGELVWWDDHQSEINLWTYWQGRGVLSPQILLVGQDWGAPSSRAGRVAVENIRNGRAYHTGAIFPTDKHLITLFREGLDMDITQRRDDLFFTNFILGYRRANNTGKFDERYYFAHDMGYFQTLVTILQPRIVICLGQQTFTYALRAFGKTVTFPHGYLHALAASETVVTIGDRRFYGMAHCGNFACLNRARYAAKHGSADHISVAEGLRWQCDDWRKIKTDDR